MKDYYDIYYLANKFDFDGATLTKSLKKTFENRGHAFTIEQFEQVMAFAENDAMQKKWKAFCRKIDTKTDTFSKVIETINLCRTNQSSRKHGIHRTLDCIRKRVEIKLLICTL